ncbi:DNA polymerase III subunit delta [Buchnera aphidicola (Diuraphis noxia)]|uniref:DNA polymerase III subunit delta n=1 Tax=Buchnera aphidicola subsp. Diuraphis noxia TaxID=118101 RepID=A0A1B2H9C3_BUCDN|nr:DNA polymerase III subunit delta [Buchnera aphidicola]ANZ22639.1 DNA polymerase III subunit delta [Buchnera aphidicola (Diuraphis noxia)]
MNIIHLDKFQQHLNNKLNSCYIFLGEDLFLLNKNQNLLLKFANQNGFTEIFTVNIENNQDWEKILNFCNKRNLFLKKTTLIINFSITYLNKKIIKSINEINSLFCSDILFLLKFNHLSHLFKNNQSLNIIKNYGNMISCCTPYNLDFINWIKYEINKKNIKIEEKAFFLLCKYYEGNTSFINDVLDFLFKTCPNISITIENMKKIITEFFNFLPLHWINAILQNNKEKAIYILHTFYQKKYNPLILIRILQKDLLILIYAKHEKIININMLLKKHNVWNTRYKFFKQAIENINYQNCLQAIKILLKIEINIKQKYSKSVWIQLYELTLTLC